MPSAPDAAPQSSAGDTRSNDELFAALALGAGTESLAGAWLELQCRLVRGCRRGVVLLGPADRGPFSTAASWPEGKGAARSLLAAAEDVLVKRAPALVVPEEGGASLEGAIVAEPILLDGALLGAAVFEVAPRASAELESVQFQLRLAFGWLDASRHRSRAESEKIGKSQLEIVLGLLAAALEHERFQGGVTAFATELASELGCERVSIGFLRHKRVRVDALSHSAQFGERTILIRAVEAAMDEAVDQESTVIFPPPEGELPRACHAHSELARQFGANAICTVPLVRAGTACGAVTLERNTPFDPRTLRVVEVAAALSGPALEGLRREDRFVGTKVVEATRGVLDAFVGPRHVALKLIAAAIALVVIFFAVVKGDFRVTAETTLEPMVKRAAVAPFEGYIAEAPARAGDVVQEGALLGSLNVRDLRLEAVKWASEYEQAQRQYRQALAARDAAQAEIHAAASEESRAELDLVQDRLAKAELRAPFDGVVVTGDLTQRLGAPVKRGEVLFEVAPLNAYRLYLKVREADIDHVAVGQKGMLVLSSLPQESYAFTVSKITPVATAQEGKNTFRVEGSLDDPGTRLRPGMDGVGKIEAGRQRLLWIWTHDAVNWMRLKFWSWSR